MYPVIYDFGVVDLFGFQFRLAIYSFGLMLVAAFYTCYFLLDKDLRELGYDEKLASDIIFFRSFHTEACTEDTKNQKTKNK